MRFLREMLKSFCAATIIIASFLLIVFVNGVANAEPIKSYKAEIDSLNEEDFLSLAMIVEAESQGSTQECAEGVVVTIINRKWAKGFPNTVKKVIYQKGQFWVKGMKKPTQKTLDAIEAVRQHGNKVLQDRLDQTEFTYDAKQILYFSTDWCQQVKYATDFVKVGGHWYGRGLENE